MQCHRGAVKIGGSFFKYPSRVRVIIKRVFTNERKEVESRNLREGVMFRKGGIGRTRPENSEAQSENPTKADC